MTTNRLTILVSVGLAVVSAGYTRANLVAAQREHRADAARLSQLTEDVRRLEELRGTEQRARESEPAENDLLGAVRDILERVGLDANTFRGLATTGSESVRGHRGYRRTRYRLQLAGLDAVALGGFLAAWQELQPLWSVSRIELRRSGQSARRGRPDSNTGYAVTISLETVYADRDGVDREQE